MRVIQAFIPGAGLGTRLRPLTERLPKPLVPLFHRPLAEWAMEACVRAGIRLHRKTGLPILVTGGVLAPGATPIAAVMAQVMGAEYATPPRWVEDRSRDTWENATFSAAMLKAEGITSVYLVTTSWHMPRSILAFERAGLAVTAAPVRAPDYVAGFDIIPQASGWQASYYAMHELIGYLWYRLRP